MTPYEEFQMTMYGNVLPESGNSEEEDENERFEQWSELMEELQMME